MRVRALVALGLAVVLGGCAREKEAALLLVVKLDGTVSTNVLVTATGGSIVKKSNCIKVAGRTRLEVAVVQGNFPEQISLEARGYTDDACSMATEPPESGGPIDVRFRANAIVDKELTLRPEMPRQETNCANGLDDDGDGKKDCADFDCNDRACSTGNLCVEGQTCQNSQCVGGSQVTCNSPPQCFSAMGVCVVTSGCRYVPAGAGGNCNDGDGCTEMDSCQADGRCTGMPKQCNSPPAGQCFLSAAGSCLDGGCVYRGREDAGCNDNDNCTIQDRCTAGAACVGQRVSCAPRECQVFTNTCDGDGGCVYSNLDAGLACGSDGGLCNEQGGCIAFPFVPSNLSSVTQIPTPQGDVTLDCGETVIDTGANGVPVTTNWCPGQPRFGYAGVVQDGGVAAAVLSFGKLEVRAGATLKLVGVRPAIIVANNVTVLGSIVAEAGAQACTGAGAGGNGSDEYVGGGGGGFGSAGGRGGANPTNSVPLPGGGGVNGNVELTPLRGGCPGGQGTSRRAAGGGGVQVTAAGDVIIAGAIAAPGEGGRGGGAFVNTAANGGASGGGILLEAARVTASAGAIVANGGGGGEGGGVTVSGKNGDRGSLDSKSPAAGGSSVALGGAGGNGAAGATGATDGTQSGGGGGGGVGRIRVNYLQQCSIGPQVAVSPEPTSSRDAGCQ